jgi:hypothetical protein
MMKVMTLASAKSGHQEEPPNLSIGSPRNSDRILANENQNDEPHLRTKVNHTGKALLWD